MRLYVHYTKEKAADEAAFSLALRVTSPPGPSPALPAVAGEGGASARSFVTRHSSLVTRHFSVVTRHLSLVTRLIYWSLNFIGILNETLTFLPRC
jgi:hypothetical protein